MPVAGRLYSKTIIQQGDPNAAAVNNGGPIPTTLVITPTRLLPWRSTTTTRIGDPNAAPAAPPISGAPLVIQSAQQRAQRSAITMGASAAEVLLAGAMFVTPIQQRPVAPPQIIVRQLQDGAAAAQGGPVPTALIVTRPPEPRPLTRVLAFVAAPAQAPFVATPPAIVVTRIPPKTRLRRLITIRSPLTPPVSSGVSTVALGTRRTATFEQAGPRTVALEHATRTAAVADAGDRTATLVDTGPRIATIIEPERH